MLNIDTLFRLTARLKPEKAQDGLVQAGPVHLTGPVDDLVPVLCLKDAQVPVPRSKKGPVPVLRSVDAVVPGACGPTITGGDVWERNLVSCKSAGINVGMHPLVQLFPVHFSV